MKFLSSKVQSNLLLRFLLVSSVLLLIYTVIWIIIARNQIINTAYLQRQRDIQQTEKTIAKLKNTSARDRELLKQNTQQLTVNNKEILQPLTHIILFAVLLFGSSLVFAVLLSLTVENSFISSLGKLLEGARNYGKGNLNYRISLNTNDEMEELSYALNTLAGDLQKAYANLEFDKSTMQQEREQLSRTLQAEKEKMNYVMFAEREKVNYVLSAIADGVIILSKDRRVMLLNKTAEELTGYSAAEVMQKPLNGVMKFFEKDREIYWDEYAPLQDNNALKGGVYKNQQVRLETPNIKPRTISLIAMKTRFSQTEDLGYILVLHDQTEKLEVEKMEMDFVGSVAAELQQPLQFIKQCFTLLRQSDEQISQNSNIYITGIQMGLDQLTYFLENLMTLTRIEQGAFALNPQQIDVTALVKQIVADLTPQATGRQVNLGFIEPKDPVPAVSADATALREVLINILMNAIVNTPNGGSVAVSLNQTDMDIFVHVQDTGIGIPRDAMNNLFTKFYRIPDRQSGAGLGLSLCKSLIEMQQGKIWADSIEGRGSTFSFSLPKAA